MTKVTQKFQSHDFEGKYKGIPSMDIPMMSIPPMMGGAAAPPQRSKKEAKKSPRFVEGLEDITCRTGSIATLSVVIEAQPEAHIQWFKDGKRLINSGKIS